MIDQLKLKLEELEAKKQNMKPKINEMNAQREEELNVVNEKYDKLVGEINSEVYNFELQVNNDLINSFVKAVMDEFDLKRSTSEYSISSTIKEYKEYIATVEMFPEELVDRLEKLIEGDPIENIAYDIEKIQEKFIKS
jgi:enoyl-[acyl-carrier-protein] reductase (NADH)